MSVGVQAYSRQMQKLETALGTTIQTEMLLAATKVARTVIGSSVASVTNGGRLRHVGKHGARVGVTSRILTEHSAIVQATGPMQIIERDTRPHQIPRTVGNRRIRTPAGRLSHKRESTGRVLSGRKPLLINGDWVMGPVSHPGTKGKHPFEHGVLALESGNFALIAAHQVFAKNVQGIFRG